MVENESVHRSLYRNLDRLPTSFVVAQMWNRFTERHHTADEFRIQNDFTLTAYQTLFCLQKRLRWCHKHNSYRWDYKAHIFLAEVFWQIFIFHKVKQLLIRYTVNSARCFGDLLPLIHRHAIEDIHTDVLFLPLHKCAENALIGQHVLCQYIRLCMLGQLNS